MKAIIEQALMSAIEQCQSTGTLPNDLSIDLQIERTRDESHGDYASNVALMLAKPAKKAPRDIAQALTEALPPNPAIQKVEIAGPGFINFFLSQTAQVDVVKNILEAKQGYGHCNLGHNQRIYLEYVSANPTGPLHVGHGRGAAFGASLANVLKAAGYDVHQEYYVNDAGRQMAILAASIWLRYLALFNIAFTFPCNGYKGDYINDIAQSLKDQVGDEFVREAAAVFADVPADEPQGGDKEKHIDALVHNCKTLLGEEGYLTVFNLGLDSIVNDIRQDLGEFGVTFDEWFSEKHLATSGAVQHCFDVLKEAGHTYIKNDALWFKSTEFGDDKDRVMQRANGQTTYFASDIAYMLNKFERGADKLIYIFGADHHGYLPRLRACIEALGHKNEDVAFELVQFAILYRGEERVQMSTRSGSFVTMRDLRKEVGNDAARFFYVMRKCDQHMDFDLELAKSQSNDNPVYYIQYAHARICNVFAQLPTKGWTYDEAQGFAALPQLQESHEDELLRMLWRYADTLKGAAEAYEPHRIAVYLRDLANAFHSYYNAHMFLVEDEKVRNARLSLIKATQQVLHNGLSLLGVSAPESM